MSQKYAMLVATIVTSWGNLAEAQQVPPADTDPHLVVGYEKCAKCHDAEIDVWKKTPHHQTFTALHRNPDAQQIAGKLGLKSIKRNDVCIQCHYTQQHRNGKIKPISGVSCESCHGPAEAWLESHSDYGGPNVSREQETAEHKRQRRQLAIQQGMRNPVNPYLIARSCLACHTTPNEQLVNVGGHRAGSQDFEFVRWSQGMIRHNFLSGSGKQNRSASLEERRVFYLVGLMTDLEFSLRATAEATQKGVFAVASARRVDRLRKHLKEIQQELNNPYVERAIDAAYQAKLKLNNREALESAANAVGQATHAFSVDADGTALSVVDTWLPDPSTYK